MHVNKYLQLFRTGNALMGIIGVVVAAFMAAGTDIVNYPLELALSAAVVFFFICGGNALNDGIDEVIDRTAHPERPVPSGLMTAQHAKNVGLAMLALAVVLSVFTFDVLCIAIVIVAAVLMVAYETVLKQRGFVGNVTIAVLTGLMFVLGGAVVGHAQDNIVIGLMAMLVSIGREIAKDIEDMDSDEGRSTLPMRIGVRASSALACVFFIAGPVLSIAPMVWGTYGVLYYTVVVADLMFLFCAAKVFSDPHKAQKTCKMAMFVALLAFILGVFRF